MKVVAKQWFLLKQLLLRPLCSILKVKVEDESDGKTKVSETTLCETPIIYLESESDGKRKVSEIILCETLVIYLESESDG